MQMTTLNQSLDQPLTSEVTSEPVRGTIAQALWNINLGQLRTTENAFKEDLESYFAYYSRQRKMFLREDGSHLSVNTHQDVVDIADALLRKNLGRANIKSKFRCHHPHIDEPQFEVSINFTSRLLFMMSIGTAPYVVPGGTDLIWKDDSGPIKDFIAAQFSSTSTSGQAIRLGPLFTAQNLDRIAGLKITWTDDISDHLRLFNNDTEVAIFHHASFLMIAKEAHLFPLGFAEETLKTLSLLLPKMNESSKKWFRRLAMEQHLDLGAHSCLPLQTRDRQIGEFKFWHDRLVILKEAFDECEPSTWKQWWYDKRKGLSRWPFLIAASALALTAFFGLVQSIEGAIQVYKAYHPSS